MSVPLGDAYRVLVTGSRDWDDEAAIQTALVDAWVRSNGRPFVVVHGACPTGADAVADKWAVGMASLHPETSVERHPADWDRYGRQAGPIRNAAMVAAGAELCLAFIRAGSRGASHCAQLAERAGIQTVRWLR